MRLDSLTLPALVAVLVVALAAAGTVSAQTTSVLNNNVVQPDVWRPTALEEPGVDAKGDLNLQVPALTVPGVGGLDFPITFSYASSIRFDERASWIGTGWHFDPGSITRDVFWGENQGIDQHPGDPDYANYTDYTETPSFQPDRYVVSMPGGGATMSRVTVGGYAKPRPNASQENGLDAGGFYTTDSHVWDIAPVIDTDGVTVRDGVNGPEILTGVTTTNGAPSVRADYSKFTITTEDGTRYVYAHPTLTSSVFSSTEGNARRETYVGAWRLVNIFGPTYRDGKGPWVQILYSEIRTAHGSTEIHGIPFAQSTYPTHILTPTHCASFTTELRGPENFKSWESSLYSRLASVELYASQNDPGVPVPYLTGPDGTSPGGVQANGACPGQLVRKIVLNTSTEIASESGSGRLALRNINIQGESGVAEPGYEFSYYPASSHERNVIGGQTDLFGFYDRMGGIDGVGSSGTVPGRYDSECQGNGLCNDGQSFSMQTVQYPSGGSDHFYYENDEIRAQGGTGPGAHPHETITYGEYFTGIGGFGAGTNSLRFALEGGGLRQGGARVTRIVRNDGTYGAGNSEETTYSYAPGHVSAIPPKWWSQTRYQVRGVSLPTARAAAEVYYPRVTRFDPDGSRVETYYTTSVPGEHLPGFTDIPVVPPVRTVVWRNASWALTTAEGNQDTDWGREARTRRFSASGQIVQTVNRELLFRRQTLARTWNVSGLASQYQPVVHWALPDLRSVRTVDHSLGQEVVQRTYYTYFTGLVSNLLAPDPRANNLLRRTETVVGADRRVVDFLYAHEVYSQLDEQNRIGEVALQTTALLPTLSTPPPPSIPPQEIAAGEYAAASETPEYVAQNPFVPGEPYVCVTAPCELVDLPDLVEDDPDYPSPPPPPPAPTEAQLTYYAASATTFRIVDGASKPVAQRSILPHRSLVWDAAAPYVAVPPVEWHNQNPTYLTWTTASTVRAYDSYRRLPTDILDAAGLVVQVDYGNWWTPERVEIPAAGERPVLARTFGYDTAGRLSLLTDENNHSTAFAYDTGGRLSEVRDGGPTGPKLSSATYTFGFGRQLNSSYLGFNRVVERAYSDETGNAYSETATFTDGLGRPTQTLERDSTGRYVATLMEHRLRQDGSAGLVHTARTWRPVVVSANSNDPSVPASTITGAAQSYYAAERPYTETYTRQDGTGRPMRVEHPYKGNEPGGVPTTRFDYSVAQIGNVRYRTTETTDEAGDREVSYTDANGRTVRVTRGVGTLQAATTRTDYDVLDRPTAVWSPNALALPGGSQESDWRTTYVYDTRGRVRETTSPDAGTVRIAYDRAGRVRLVQDANHAAAPERVLYTSYDVLGRPVRRGEAPGSFASLASQNGDAPYSFESDPSTWLEAHHYDARPSPYWIGMFSSYVSSQSVQNTKGRPTASATRSGDAWQLELSSYDGLGRLDRRGVRTSLNGTVDASFNTDLAYSYDLQGRLLSRSASVNGLPFYHSYLYNGRGLNRSLSAQAWQGSQPLSCCGGGPQFAVLDYTYGPSGEVKTTTRDGTMYRNSYDVRGRLTVIGGTEFSKHNLNSTPFTAGYSYGPDGTVTRARFATLNVGAFALQGGFQEDQFDYGYDGLDRLVIADHVENVVYDGPPGPAASDPVPSGAYDLTGITYDANGNLVDLVRRDRLGAVIDRLMYQYNRSNRLVSIFDIAGNGSGTPATWDAESGALQYDPNGNAVALPAPYNLTAAVYDSRNLPTEIVTGQSTSSYRYAASGQRYLRVMGPQAAGNRAAMSREAAPGAPELAAAQRAARAPASPAAIGTASPWRPDSASSPQSPAETPATTASAGRAPETSSEAGARFGGTQSGRFGASARTQNAPARTAGAARTGGAASPGTPPSGLNPRGVAPPSETPSRGAAPERQATPLARGGRVGRADRSTGSNDPSSITSASADTVRTGAPQRRTGLGAEAPGSPFAAASRAAGRGVSDGGVAEDEPLTDLTPTPDGEGLYYTALDALSGAGIQPSVAEVRKTTSGVRVFFEVLSPSGEALGVQEAHYNGPIAVSPIMHYYHKDLLGSVRAVAESYGRVAEARTYDAWGVALEGRGGGGSEGREGYTGHPFDGETGMNYAGARYYMPALGRWTAVDPLASSFASYSPYNYALNNPLSLTDPTGMAPEDCDPPSKCLKAAAAGIRDAAVGMYDRAAAWVNNGQTAGERLRDIARSSDIMSQPDMTRTNPRAQTDAFIRGARRAYNSLRNSSGEEISRAAGPVLATGAILAATRGRGGSIGFAEGTGATALEGMAAGGGHAIRHMQTAGIISNTGSLASRVDAFAGIAVPILENPSHSAAWRIGATQGQGFLGTVGNRQVMVIVAREGPQQGRVISAIVPDANQLRIFRSR